MPTSRCARAAARRYGTKAEIKNMNSFRTVLRAIESEIARQEAILRGGGRVVQETRGWDEAAGVTHSMRSKEQAHDYRYFPDPDLVPIEFAAADVERLRPRHDELPQRILASVDRATGIPVARAHQIVDDARLAAYLRRRQRARRGAPAATANFVLADPARLANESGRRDRRDGRHAAARDGTDRADAERTRSTRRRRRPCSRACGGRRIAEGDRRARRARAGQRSRRDRSVSSQDVLAANAQIGGRLPRR